MDAFFYFIAGLSCLVWIAIILLPWQPWRNREILEKLNSRQYSPDLSQVTVVIPARDEAALIAKTLESLAAPGSGLRVILIDDGSRDGTAQIANSVKDIDLKIINGAPLPAGWTGKLWALEQGVRQVETRLTLLLDADILLSSEVIATLQNALDSHSVQFISIMATLRMQNFWEKLLNPAFIFFFKLLYPFRLSNSANPRFAAAAGGCILLETRIFSVIGGLASIRGALIDDCALAKVVKNAGFRTWIGQSLQVRSIRPYRGLSDIWNMVARSAFTQLGYSVVLLLLCTLFLLVMFWAPVIGLFSPLSTVVNWSIIAWLAMVLVYLPTLRFYRRTPAWVLLLPFVGALYLAMTWHSALRYWRGERSRWKDRVYKTS